MLRTFWGRETHPPGGGTPPPRAHGRSAAAGEVNRNFLFWETLELADKQLTQGSKDLVKW